MQVIENPPIATKGFDIYNNYVSKNSFQLMVDGGFARSEASLLSVFDKRMQLTKLCWQASASSFIIKKYTIFVKFPLILFKFTFSLAYLM